MNAGLPRKRAADRGALAKLLAKGSAGPLGPGTQPANPKDVSKEAQSIRLARLLVGHR